MHARAEVLFRASGVSFFGAEFFFFGYVPLPSSRFPGAMLAEELERASGSPAS